MVRVRELYQKSARRYSDFLKPVFHLAPYGSQSNFTYLCCDGSSTYRRMESFVTRSYTCRLVMGAWGPAKTTVREALRKGGLTRAARSILFCRKAVPVLVQFRLDESRAKYISPDSKYAYDQFNI